MKQQTLAMVANAPLGFEQRRRSTRCDECIKAMDALVTMSRFSPRRCMACVCRKVSAAPLAPIGGPCAAAPPSALTASSVKPILRRQREHLTYLRLLAAAAFSCLLVFGGRI
jgi:hypothetical protein